MMYSLDLNRLVSFPHMEGRTFRLRGRPTEKLAFSSSREGTPTSTSPMQRRQPAPPDQRQGAGRFADLESQDRRADCAFVSGRTGLPQIYTMESDGTNLQRVTDQGYAVSPSWSPNGQFLVLAWMRKYGPGAPGANDIYLMDIASKQWVQLTHDGGRNDFPSWSPDGRHIVFQSNRSGKEEIWMMLADGTKLQQLTFTGRNTQPNWSWK